MQVVDVKEATLNLVHDLGRLLLGGECFNEDFVSNYGSDIVDRVQL